MGVWLKRSYPESHAILFCFWLALVAFIFIIAQLIIFNSEQTVLAATNAFSQLKLTSTIKLLRISPVPPPARAAKGVYVTANTAGSARMENIIDLVNATELDTVVIDIKDYSGWVAYDSDVALADELGTEKIRIKNLPALLKRLDTLGIYKIARMQVFQDPVLAEKRPDLAIKNIEGAIWTDWKELAWLDPHSQEVWDYHVALAKDAIEKGFDEINFDYTRFPSDGPISEARYPLATGENKIKVINNFFEYLSTSLSDEPAYLSVDLFGMTLWSEDDFNIGQTLDGAIGNFDYISPMVYPSHYARGFAGFENPAEYPYEVVFRNLEKASSKLEGTQSQFRPWLQDFNLGARYTPEMVRAQIKAAEENNTFGWLLWNASNNYTREALRPTSDN